LTWRWRRSQFSFLSYQSFFFAKNLKLDDDDWCLNSFPSFSWLQTNKTPKATAETVSLGQVELKSDKLGRRRKSLYTPFYRQSHLEVSTKAHNIFSHFAKQRSMLMSSETIWKFVSFFLLARMHLSIEEHTKQEFELDESSQKREKLQVRRKMKIVMRRFSNWMRESRRKHGRSGMFRQEVGLNHE
jgi:hypothetical protein